MEKFNIDRFIKKEEVSGNILELADEFVGWIRGELEKESNVEKAVKMLKDCTAGDEDSVRFVRAKIRLFLVEKGVKEQDIGGLIDKIYSINYGLGVLDDLYKDDDVGEIFVNGTAPVWVEKGGKRLKTDVRFNSDEELVRVIRRAVEFSNQNITDEDPRVHANRYDNSRIYAAIPPIAARPYLRIRKFTNFKVSEENYIAYGTASRDLLGALRVLVRYRANILVIGSMSSGKTTLLKLLAGYMPEDQAVTVLETTPELFLDELYPEKNIMSVWENKAIGIEMEDLFIDALRSSADRIICGEARGKEASQLVEGMSRGMEGSLATIHSSGAYASIDDLARMCALGGNNINVEIMRCTIANAVDIVISMHRCEDGARRIVDVSEIVYDMNSGAYDAKGLFEWNGEFRKTGGISDKLRKKLEKYGATSEELGVLV